MGKIPPPPEIYSDWTPEAQAGYDMPLNNMAMQRENCYAEADQLDASAAQHQHNADMYQMTIDKDMGKNAGDSAKFDSTVLLVYKEEHLADKDREAAAAKRAEAEELDETINKFHVPVEDMNQTPADLNERQQAYAEQLREQIAADQAKLVPLNQELAKLQAELDDKWFFTGDLEKAIAELESKIASVEGDISFNQTCLDNTIPPPPPPPPAPTPVGNTFVGTSAKMTCPFAMGGTAPFAASPSRKTFVEGKPMGNVLDFVSMTNIPSFGVCSTLTNPAVAAATSAALGVLTPQPCVPVITGPWHPGKPDVLVEGAPALLRTDTCQCAWGGVITIIG